jgi:molybdopterin-guanine dinucleotide biosynthesis protein MobB
MYYRKEARTRALGTAMRALIFCGHHNAGKTTLLLRAVRGLTAKGYTVSTVKHSPGMGRNPSSSSDSPITGNNDSARLLAAGSTATVLVTTAGALLQRMLDLDRSKDHEATLREILAELHSDFALVEGFKRYRGTIPKVLLVHTAEEISALADESTIAYSGIHAREGWSVSLPFLPHATNEEGMADFVLRYAREAEPSEDITL